MATPKTLLSILDSITAPEIASPQAITATTEKHYARVRTIFEDENIVGAGIARKVSDDEPAAELGIVFYVREKVPTADLRPNQLLPPVMAAPNGRAVYTDVVEIGDIVPQVNSQQVPIQSGYSVGWKEDTTGTLGAIVRKEGKQYLLSNSHVLANSGLATVSDPIIFPGNSDGGTLGGSRIGRLHAFIPFAVGDTFTNSVDAALAELDPAMSPNLDMTILGAAIPFKVGTPVREMAVTKRGRTTGDTTSVVRDVDFRILIRYPGVGVVGFTGQALCDTYTQPGDSGSIVVASDSGAIVGLHFAGSSKGSVFTPIRTVIEALQFRF